MLRGEVHDATGILELFKKKVEADLSDVPWQNLRTDTEGSQLYHTYCARCHGAGAIGNGMLPDLRKISAATQAAFPEIVLRGAYRAKGMPGFDQWLNEADVQKIKGYLLAQNPPAGKSALNEGGEPAASADSGGSLGTHP